MATEQPKQRRSVNTMTDAQEWWTDERVELWEQLDDIRQAVESELPDNHTTRMNHLHTSAPNPDGLNDVQEWCISGNEKYRQYTDQITEILDELTGCEIEVVEIRSMTRWHIVGWSDD